MRKLILYAGIALVLSFYAVSNIEAGSSGFNVSIDSTDPCAGGAADSTYIFTAKSGSNKQITMARRETKEYDEYSSTDWYYYDLPVYTKTQVQAGYYIDKNDNNKRVLVMVYSADKEGKSGAIVSRISKDYGKTWSASKTVTNDKLKFGLAVAPYSLFVAFHKDKEVSVKKHIIAENKWVYSCGPIKSTKCASNGLAVLSLYDGDPNKNGKIYVALVDDGNNARLIDIDKRALGFSVSQDRTSSTHKFASALEFSYYRDYIAPAVRCKQKDRLGFLTLSGGTSEYDLISFWANNYTSSISGVWKCKITGTEFVLSIDNKNIVGAEKYGKETVLYKSNQGTSMQRRVSMFNVPAKP